MKKITKSQVKAIAKREYIYGGYIEFYMLPCKVALDNSWIEPFQVIIKEKNELEKIINEYSYYNCNNELGLYPSYYITDNYARYLLSEYK